MEVTKGYVIDDAFDEKYLHDEKGASLAKGRINKRGRELIKLARKDGINLSVVNNKEMCETYLRYMDELSKNYVGKPFVVLGNTDGWNIDEQDIMNRLNGKYVIINMQCSPKDYNNVIRYYLDFMATYRKQSKKRRSSNLSFEELKRRGLIRDNEDNTKKKIEEDLSDKPLKEILVSEDKIAETFYYQ